MRSRRRVGSTSASPSARKTRRTTSPQRSPVSRMLSRTSASARARNCFCGAVYISQKVQWFHEQPSVTGRISDSASLGGL
ncbi:MAG: hypothetical protein AW07_01951 [Candidatus Accumulibacter sp. SK-11]|nr:MAG: hypothetical protein AW07_01951 [Candidatus Accumulibacter sp. SK-11]